MATLADILGYKWSGNQWAFGSATNDDYADLQWGGPDPKPTEAEIRAFSAEIDARMVSDRALQRQQGWLEAQNADYLLIAFETLIEAEVELKRVIDDLQAKIKATALSAPLTTFDSAVLQKVVGMRNKLIQARSR